jgi:hypothetical protein
VNFRRCLAAGLGPTLVVLAAACGGGSGEIRPPVSSMEAPRSAGTPGTCGAWEATDSTAIAECRRAMRSSRGVGNDSLYPGACGFSQSIAVDSLRACLDRLDTEARACPAKATWRVRQADGVVRAAEWRQCGTTGGEWIGDSAVYPLHYLLLHGDSTVESPLIFGYANSEEPGVSGLDTVTVQDLDGDGTDEIMTVEQIYGTGAAFEVCALAVVGTRLRCWSGPKDSLPQGTLRPGEQLFKGWIPVAGGPDAGSGGFTVHPDHSYWVSTPVYREGDANCCPGAGASLYAQVLARDAAFRDGLLLRVTEDSTGVPLAVDTLRR